MAGTKPDYTIDPLLFEILDEAVNWAEELQIYLLIDNHSTDDIASKNPDLELILIKVWEQMAMHYKDRSNFILFEILNEPNDIDINKWAQIQQKAIDAIRNIDTKHTLIVGAANFNTYNDLTNLPIYTDTNLIYTFHFYDPFLFTHQGASWPNPPLTSLAYMPYPYNADSMPEYPTVFDGTWLESAYQKYNNEGTAAHIQELIEIAVAFQKSRNVPVYCGELGVYIPYSNTPDRVAWYKDVRTCLEENNISWTIWDYQAGFGLFEKGSNEMFDYDLNIPLVNALGLIEPEQWVYEMKPDSVGFNLYSDFIGEKIFESSNANGGNIDYYSTDKPNNQKYNLFWTGSNQYGSIGFNFMPDKDLSALVDSNYALSFLVRGNSPGTKIEVRFIDSKTTDPNDHPWRMNYTLGENDANWDGKWHSVYIPLKNFIDQGSWDNEWFNPQGSFNWKEVDRFEIVTDQGSLSNKAFWFDNLIITNLDTALVYDTTVFELPTTPNSINTIALNNLTIYPNPTRNETTIAFSLNQSNFIEISILDINGRKIKSLVKSNYPIGNFSIVWDTDNAHGNKVSSGIYFCSITTQNEQIISKIIVLK
jgi:endoglucanase